MGKASHSFHLPINPNQTDFLRSSRLERLVARPYRDRKRFTVCPYLHRRIDLGGRAGRQHFPSHAYFVLEAMFRREGVLSRSLRTGVCVEPSIEATRTKNGICSDDEVQKENIKFSISHYGQAYFESI